MKLTKTLQAYIVTTRYTQSLEIAVNGGAIKVGERERTSGNILTLELYKEMESACEKSGSFELI